MATSGYDTIRPTQHSLNINSFDDLLSSVALRTRPDRDVVIDLQGLKFIDLFAMVGLVYVCQDLHETGAHRHVRLEVDIDGDGACGFLPRMGFFDVLGEFVELPEAITPEKLNLSAKRRGTNEKLLELTPIADDPSIKQIIDRLQHILLQRMDYPRYRAFDISIAVSELCHNISEHNYGCIGLAAMQEYNPDRGRSLQFIIADRGSGIGNTLRRNPKYQFLSERAAIRESMGLGASEYEDTTRGNGLYHLQRLVKQQGGTLDIRSGRAKIHMWNNGKLTDGYASFLPGTQVILNIPTWN